MVALYFDFKFLEGFATRDDKMDPVVYDFYFQFFRRIRGVEVFINIESSKEIQKLIDTNEFYWHLSEINSPVSLSFKERLLDPEFYKKGAISKFFFVEDCDEEKLQNEFNCYFITNKSLRDKWQLFLSNREDRELLVKSNPHPKEIGVFRSWKDLDRFKHKASNILVFDLFVMANKKNQEVKYNLLPCITQLFNDTKGIDGELTIITKDLNQNRENFWLEKDVRQLVHQLSPIHSRVTNINFMKYDKTKITSTDQEHNRCILTNYFYIRFPAGINVFKSNGKVNHRDEITFDSILKNSTRTFVKELLKNLKDYRSNLKQTYIGIDGRAQRIEHYYFYPSSNCRYLD